MAVTGEPPGGGKAAVQSKGTSCLVSRRAVPTFWAKLLTPSIHALSRYCHGGSRPRLSTEVVDNSKAMLAGRLQTFYKGWGRSPPSPSSSHGWAALR